MNQRQFIVQRGIQPINIFNNEKMSQCSFFYNESLSPLGWMTPFPWQKILHRSPVELYSGLSAPCQILTSPQSLIKHVQRYAFMEDATHHSHPHNSVRDGLAFIVKLRLHLSIQLHKCPTADLDWSFIEITTTTKTNKHVFPLSPSDYHCYSAKGKKVIKTPSTCSFKLCITQA